MNEINSGVSSEVGKTTQDHANDPKGVRVALRRFDLAMKEYFLNKGTQAEGKSRQNVLESFEKLERLL